MYTYIEIYYIYLYIYVKYVKYIKIFNIFNLKRLMISYLLMTGTLLVKLHWMRIRLKSDPSNNIGYSQQRELKRGLKWIKMDSDFQKYRFILK